MKRGLLIAIAVTTSLSLLPTGLMASTLFVTAFVDDHVYQVSETGVVSTYATLPVSSRPYGLAVDASGNVYAADFGTQKVSKITTGGAVSSFATLSTGNPTGLTFDNSGNLYVAGLNTSVITAITPGGVTSTFANLGSGVQAYGMDFDSSGRLYVADFINDRILQVSADGTTVSTFATLASGARPYGLAFDSNGDLYVSESGTFVHDISKISASGTVSLFKALNSGTSPSGLAFDSTGNLFVAAQGTNSILQISADGSTLSTYATGLSLPQFLAFQESVPEPSRMLLLMMGALGVMLRRRR